MEAEQELLERARIAQDRARALQADVQERLARLDLDGTAAASQRLRTESETLRATRAHYRNLLDELQATVGQLEQALQNRGMIEQAKGIIMAQEHCDADAAFTRLRERSQHANRKLNLVAAELVDETVWAQRDSNP